MLCQNCKDKGIIAKGMKECSTMHCGTYTYSNYSMCKEC